jgi:serine/threonine protein kinase
LSQERHAVPAEDSSAALEYIAPEQTGRMNRAIDRRSDLYSLGACFYRLFTGRPPFQARDPLELLHCHLTRTPQPPHELVPDVPEPLSRLVLKLLSKVTEDRYQSAAGSSMTSSAFSMISNVSGALVTCSWALVISAVNSAYHKRLYVVTPRLPRCCERGPRPLGAAEVLLIAGQSGIGNQPSSASCIATWRVTTTS